MTMASPNETPMYNLKVVVNETGIKADTLRAWERRYGLPKPNRTNGGHRLYSDKDIAIVKWLMGRQEAGLSISKAVKLWSSLETNDDSPLRALDSQNKRQTAVNGYPQLDGARVAWIEACLNFDEAAAEGILTQAFATYQPEMVLTQLLQRGLADVGERWFNGNATVQQEHFASALAMRRLNSLLAASPAPTRAGRLLIGCPPHEYHDFAPLMLTILLRYRGWETIYLGANVPHGRFVSTVNTIKPNLIMMTAQQLHTAANLFEVAQSLASEKDIRLAFGGRIFNVLPKLRKRIPGYFLGETIEDAAQTVEKLLNATEPFLPVQPIPDIYLQALAIFRDKQALIEATAWNILKTQGISYEHYTNANLHLSRDIYAALTFGDITYLSAEIAWVEKLLLNYSMPSEALRLYMTGYHQAARDHLAGPAELVVDWLSEMSKNSALMTPTS